MIAIIVLLILLLLFWLFSKENFIKNQPIDYFDFGKSGPQVSFIAGVHGNEPAGSVLFAKLLKTNYFAQIADKNNVRIRVIPWINKFGLKNNNRYQLNVLYPDINRNFTGEGTEPVSQELLKLLISSDIVVDFHEGWGYHQINRASIGSTVLPTPSMQNLANQVITELNKNINGKKQFVIIDKICEFPSALDCYMFNKNRNYILVETTGQNNVQPLNIRMQQIQTIIEIVAANAKNI